MENNSFRCQECGDILTDWHIKFYRDAIKKGSTIVGGGVRCGRCGAVYSAQEIAGVCKVKKKTFIITARSIIKDTEFWTDVFPFFPLLAIMLVLIWWRSFAFPCLWLKICLSIIAVVIANYLIPCICVLASKWKTFKMKKSANKEA